MGQRLELVADDGHRLGAYRADPGTPARGGIVVLQEIFGVNGHIRSVADRFAQAGYATIAPALFDRSSKRDVELGYEAPDARIGMALRQEFSWDLTIKDAAAAAEALRAPKRKLGVVGFCWGGTLAFLCATRLPFDAAIVYYGGQITPYVQEQERCPLLMHFGRRDHAIPQQEVEAIRAAHPRAQIHLYDAGHGFNCDQRASYDATAAALAAERTAAFLTEHVG